MPDTFDRAAQIRSEMRTVRAEVDADVRYLVNTAKTLTDWHFYVRNYPWLSSGLAVALGFMVVPRRPQIVRLDASGVRELANDKRVVVEVAPSRGKRSDKGSPLLAALIAVAGRSLMQGGMAAAQSQLQRFVGRNRKSTSTADQPRTSSHD